MGGWGCGGGDRVGLNLNEFTYRTHGATGREKVLHQISTLHSSIGPINDHLKEIPLKRDF